VLVSPFWPIIIPDKIGIIGSTHGVNANNSPKPKKLSNAQKILSCCRREAILSDSFNSIDGWGVVIGEFILVVLIS
jgi:hypothetical protein